MTKINNAVIPRWRSSQNRGVQQVEGSHPRSTEIMASKRKSSATIDEYEAEVAKLEENPAKSAKITSTRRGRGSAAPADDPALSLKATKTESNASSATHGEKDEREVIEVTDEEKDTGDSGLDNDNDDNIAAEGVDEDDEDGENGHVVSDTERAEIEATVAVMTMPELKAVLKEKKLSIKGVQKVLAKRLVDRLVKETDPAYKPRVPGRWCKWCGSQMKKRMSFKGPFYGCSSFPACQYTTSLSGYAKPDREHLKGKPATGGGGLRGPEEYAARYESYINRQARSEDRYYNKLWR